VHWKPVDETLVNNLNFDCLETKSLTYLKLENTRDSSQIIDIALNVDERVISKILILNDMRFKSYKTISTEI